MTEFCACPAGILGPELGDRARLGVPHASLLALQGAAGADGAGTAGGRAEGCWPTAARQ